MQALRFFTRAVLTVVFVTSVVQTGWCQEWARKMFAVHQHEFGTIARGSKAEFCFELTNPYLEDVRIANARSSCGCTSVYIKDDKRELKTYERGAIVARVNSGSYLGRYGATITVTFDRPYFAEVQLQVSSYIRSDVVFEPGSVQFGTVQQGQPAEQKVTVTCYSSSNWRIRELRSGNPHLTAEAVELARGPGQVRYQLTVKLSPDAPAGYLNDHLMVCTSEGQAVQIPLAVEGLVSSGLSISPSTLFLGMVQPGQTVTKQLVIKGSKPFRILGIKCDDPSFRFDTTSAGTPKLLHIIPVTFVAGGQTGKVHKTIRIETDFGDAKPELSAYAVVSQPQ